MRRVLSIFFGLALASQAAQAERLIAATAEGKTQLLELYTSESCSSCPPADRWISGLKGDTGLWKNFVPVVFHVDYWNDLGWKDGLSSQSMTKRQRDIAATWKEASVYTPAVVLSGTEWRQWRNAPLPAMKKEKAIQISIFEQKPGEFEVRVTGLPAGAKPGNYLVRIAKLGMEINSKITAGENSGLLLQHNFAVLEWDSRPYAAKLSFALKGKTEKKMAVVAWVEEVGKPIALQAAGGYL